jgi:hypothetical protein
VSISFAGAACAFALRPGTSAVAPIAAAPAKNCRRDPQQLHPVRQWPCWRWVALFGSLMVSSPTSFDFDLTPSAP